MLFLLSEITYDSEIKWCLLKNPPAIAGDVGSIPGAGRSPREGNGNPLQYSCLGSSMDRGAWWATVHGITESDVTAIKQQQHDKQVLFVPP